MKNLLTLYSVHGTFNGCNMLFIFLFPFPPVSSHRFYILIGWNFFSKILDLVPEGTTQFTERYKVVGILRIFNERYKVVGILRIFKIMFSEFFHIFFGLTPMLRSRSRSIFYYY